jgi:hypothetical protein
VDGYIGQSPWVQLPALIALGALSASLLPVPPTASEREGDPGQDPAGESGQAAGEEPGETSPAASASP